MPNSTIVQGDSTAEVGNVADLVRAAAAIRPDHTALRWHDRVLTWAEFDRQVDAAAAGLAGLGLPASDGRPARVAIVLPNVPEFAVLFFATLRAGLIAVPVNPGYTGRELNHILADCGASALLATREVITAVGDRAPGYSFGLGEHPVAAGGAPPAAPPTDIAVLLYTSGTAGAPKGAMLSHRALLANHDQLARLSPAPAGADDVVLLALPLFHAYGLNSGLVAVAYHGATGVLVERFDPGDTLATITRHGVTTVAGVPPMYVAWSLMGDRLAEAFSGVRYAVCGAAALDPETARRFADVAGRPIHIGYGLTETAPVLTSTLASGRHKVGSIGAPIPGVELRLVAADGTESDPDDEEDDGGDPGEIVVRGPNLFSGYWPDGEGGPGADGWWATGDVAYADADGDLFLVDRLGELIIVSGFNVYPHEVEQVLAAHPGVAEAAVLGVPHPYTGHTVKAFVVRSADGAGLTVEELIGYAERNLARFKCPTAVEFVAELPHSATGKVRKVALR